MDLPHRFAVLVHVAAMTRVVERPAADAYRILRVLEFDHAVPYPRRVFRIEAWSGFHDNGFTFRVTVVLHQGHVDVDESVVAGEVTVRRLAPAAVLALHPL